MDTVNMIYIYYFRKLASYSIFFIFSPVYLCFGDLPVLGSDKLKSFVLSRLLLSPCKEQLVRSEGFLLMYTFSFDI